MKFKTVSAFEKQLREAAPNHFSRVYLLLIPDLFERQFYVSKLYAFLSHYRPKLRLCRGVEALEEGLFREEKVVILEEECSLKELSHETFVVFAKEKCTSIFYESIEKEVVCLDLTGEKPWEKKERQIEELQKLARQRQKKLALSVANRLIDEVGADFARLRNELEKLLLLLGEQEEITEKEIALIVLNEKELSHWQMAEALVWKIKPLKRQEFKDLSEVLALLALVRHHLQIGLKICLGEEVEQLRKQQADIYIPFAKKRGLFYFLSRLTLLFEWEVKAKNNTIDPQTLWELWVIQHDTLASTEFAAR